MSTIDQTLDDVWQSGYCDEAVRNVRDGASREERVAWLQDHVTVCRECHTAARVKDLEARVATALGCFALFDAGGDVSTLPGFADALEGVLQENAENLAESRSRDLRQKWSHRTILQDTRIQAT